MIKLNLGCGANRRDGDDWVNVDKFGVPDVLHDLEKFPWPWADSTVDEVLLNHVLEHLGQDPVVFIGVMKELYRVCNHDAEVRIVVPHPRHDNFLNDPTHIRVVTPGVLSLFSKKECVAWVAGGFANSPLALYHGVDFSMESVEYTPDPQWKSQALHSGTPHNELPKAAMLAERYNCNVVVEIKMLLKVVKL